MSITKKINPFNRKLIRGSVAAILVVSFMSFALPREFFDPHPGFDYDIFCVSFEAVNTDQLFIPIPVNHKPIPVRIIFSVPFNEITLSQYTDCLADSRAPPVFPL